MLTAKQHQLLLYINQCLDEDGVSPSFDEMKEALGLRSKSGVHRLITALEERGFLRRLPNRARALEVVMLPDAMSGTGRVARGPSLGPTIGPWPAASGGTGGARANGDYSIPLHGRIAAGTPIEAIATVDHYITVPPEMMTHDNYALEVAGDSMVEAGIIDGDTVVIERCTTARDGEIVVALVDREEATLKELKRQGGEIALIPANQNHAIQIYPAQKVEIQGRLVGLIRRY